MKRRMYLAAGVTLCPSPPIPVSLYLSFSRRVWRARGMFVTCRYHTTYRHLSTYRTTCHLTCLPARASPTIPPAYTTACLPKAACGVGLSPQGHDV